VQGSVPGGGCRPREAAARGSRIRISHAFLYSQG
jgi:hypothetical protein